MSITIITFIVAVGGNWQSVLGQLLASGVLLASGYQDMWLRTRIGAAFGFFMALSFGISALVTAIRAGVWGGAAICVAALCLESWLISRWWSRRTSA
ncbi:MAG: hypothetical protein WBE44_06455 [Terriglobales bacterium]|jgi:hypothetical protein